MNLVPADIFTALERGVVDGIVWPLPGPRESGWAEISQNVVNEPFYNQNGGIFVNPQAWERLAPDVQAQVMEATIAFEQEMVQAFIDLNDEERRQLEDLGVSFIEFPEDESDRFHRMWYEGAWEAFGGAAGEDVTQEAKELLEFEDVRGDRDRIVQIPCAGTGTGESVLEGCGRGDQ